MKQFIRIFFFCFLNLFFCLTVKAQFPNPLDFNTATNASNTGTIPTGASDLHWTASLTNSVGPYVPAVSCGNVAPGNWATSPFINANWITYPHGCSANPAEHSCLGSIDEYYKLTFTLPATNCSQAITTASAYCLSLDFFADNWVSAIYVNGVLAVNNPNGNPYNSWGFLQSSNVTAVMCNNWQPGVNNVIVKVQSGAPSFPGYSGFLAQVNQTVNTTVGQPYMTANTTQTNVSCFGGSNGAAAVSISGGAAPYSYTWFPSGGNSNVASGLSAGNYTVVAASGSCSVTKTLTITQPASFTINASANTTVCSGATSVLSASGAASYSWSTGSTNSSISVNTPGTYTVTGFSQTGCSNSKTISVTAGVSPTLSVSGPSAICAGGTAVYNANGASSYTWSNGSQSNSISVSPPASTIYTVTGSTAGFTCAASQTVGLTVNNFLTLSVTGPTAICSGNTTTLTASGASTYTWNTGSNSNSIVVSPMTSNNYTVIGSNATNCSGTLSIPISVSAPPQISVSSGSVCPGASTIITASGAATYTWSNGALSASSSLSVAGTYTVTGANAQGCVSTQTMNLASYSLPLITITGTSSLCAGQSGSLTANGAASYTWNSGSNLQTVYLNNMFAGGVYSVNGTDNMTGCSNSQSVILTVYPLPTVSINGNTVSCNGIPVTLTAGGALTYVWNTGAFTSAINVSPNGTTTYTVTGTNSNGCSATAGYTVVSAAIPVVSAPNMTTCAGQPATLFASGASSYLWSTGETTSSVTVAPFTQTTYTVIGFANLPLCNSVNILTVSVLPSPQISLNYNILGICQGESATLVASGGNNYMWNTGSSNDSIFVMPNSTTIYTVTSAQGSNACVSSKTVMVNVYGLPPVKIIGDTFLCDGESTTLKASGASAYQWNTGSTKEQLDIIINQGAVYIVYGTDGETGCKNMDSIKVGNSEKCCEIFIPNSFTPNEDNMNEDFGAVTLCEFIEYKMYIFDKWGEQIFVSNNVGTRWNGYYKGVLCKEDVYVYLIKAKRKGIGFKSYDKTGHVSLIK